jgi:hypothetical protein
VEHRCTVRLRRRGARRGLVVTRGRVLAPSRFAIGTIGVSTGVTALVCGAPVLAAYLVSGGVAFMLWSRWLWNYQERLRARGWPE